MIDPYEGGSGKFDRDATKILTNTLSSGGETLGTETGSLENDYVDLL